MPRVVGTFVLPNLASAPASPSSGQLYYDSGTNQLFMWNGTTWLSSVSSLRTGHTWAVPGALTAGQSLPPIFVPEASAQASTLVSARMKIGSGTSIGVQVQRNGTNLGSLITVTSTAASTSFSQAITDLDLLGLVLSAPSGSPTDLSATLILEHVL